MWVSLGDYGLQALGGAVSGAVLGGGGALVQTVTGNYTIPEIANNKETANQIGRKKDTRQMAVSEALPAPQELSARGNKGMQQDGAQAKPGQYWFKKMPGEQASVNVPVTDQVIEPTLLRRSSDGTLSNDLETENRAKASRITVSDANGRAITKEFGSVEQLQQSVALPVTYNNGLQKLATLSELIQKDVISEQQARGIAVQMPMSQVLGADGKTYFVPSEQTGGLKGVFTDGNRNNSGMGYGQSIRENRNSRQTANESLNEAILDELNAAAKQNKRIDTSASASNVQEQKWDPDTSFGKSIEKILSQYGISVDEFKVSIWGDQAELNNEQKAIVRAIRETVPMPDSRTWMQKAIPFKDISLYLSGKYRQTRGFLSRMVDIEHAKTYDNMYQSLGLNYKKANSETDFKPSMDESMGVIRFRVKQGENIIVPYSKLVAGLDQTFSGNGFIRSLNGDVVPEFMLEHLTDFLEGELYEIQKDGTWILRGVYDPGQNIFVQKK